jgi:16S rRNA (cytosine1402-N4)-methyltransferase
VNDWDEENIQAILEGYGEERYARRIAQAISSARTKTPILTSGDLRDIIVDAVPAHYRHGKINPATRTFQALRIAVNDELGALDTFLSKGIDLLGQGGRFVIITFHSLEDRIVKHAFRTFAHDERGMLITKRPIQPTQEEMNKNKRARSAKLRIFQKA